MALLSCLRIILKGALPDTFDGMALSVTLYFAMATVVVLVGGAAYVLVVMPAIAQRSLHTHEEQSVHGSKLQTPFAAAAAAASHPHRPSVLLLAPTVSIGHSGIIHQGSKTGARNKSWQLQLGYSISQSMRGTPLLARAVDVGTVAGHDDLRIGSVAAAPTHNKLGTAFSHQPEATAELSPVPSCSTMADEAAQVSLHPKVTHVQLSKAMSAPLVRSGKSIMVDSTVLQGAMQTGRAPELLMTLLEQVCVLAMNEYAHVCTYTCVHVLVWGGSGMWTWLACSSPTYTHVCA
jgi:hypothetical protein